MKLPRRSRTLATALLAVLCCGFVPSPLADTVGAYTEALRWMAAARHDDALRALEAITERDPAFYRAYNKLVDLAELTGRPDAARAHFEGLLARNAENAAAYFGLGVYHRRQRDPDSAVLAFEKCIELDPDAEVAYAQLVDVKEVQRQLEHATTFVTRVAQEHPAAAGPEYGLGHVYLFQGQPEKALEHVERAIRRRPDSWEAYRDLAEIYSTRDKPKALSVLTALAERARTAGDPDRESRTLGLIGDIYLERADYASALEHVRRGLEMARELGDRLLAQSLLDRLGVLNRRVGDDSAALEMYEEALVLARELGNRRGEGRHLGLMANVHSDLGNYAQAIALFLEAIDVAREGADRTSEATQLANLGSVYRKLGDSERALSHLGLALQVVRDLRDRRLEASILLHLGAAHVTAGAIGQAKADYEQAVALSRELGNRATEASGLSGLAETHTALQDDLRAIGYLEQALALAREIGNVPLEGDMASQLGRLAARAGRDDKATAQHELALRIGERIRRPSLVWRAHGDLAELLEKHGAATEAIGHYRSAIEVIESVRGRIQVADEKAGFLADKIEPYKKLVNALVRLEETDRGSGHAVEAFQFVERARARAFLDVMAESNFRIEQGIPPELLKRRRGLETRLARIQSALIGAYEATSPNAEKIKTLELQLTQADEDYRRFEREVRSEHKRYAELQYPDVISLREAQNLLGEKTLLLEYSVGRDETLLFAIERDGFEVFRLPAASSRELLERVTQLRRALEKPTRAGLSVYVPQAASLYRDLIAPASRLLEGKDELVIVPDEALHYLPFEVLLRAPSPPNGPDTSKLHYLVRDFAIRYTPSASVLTKLEERRLESPRKTFVAFADPVYAERESDSGSAQIALRSAFGQERPWSFKPLPASAGEVASIAHLYRRDEVALFTREHATEEKIKTGEGLKPYRLIHFATHGLLNENKPELSGLVLSLPPPASLEPGKKAKAAAASSQGPTEDGLLQVYEIFNLRLSADLVVLSACETGLGKEVRGEGLIGLARAFMYAGARSVVVSLWKVGDRSTATLMVPFYRHLGTDSGSRAKALRQAQLELIRRVTYSHPYFWAPFVLMGAS